MILRAKTIGHTFRVRVLILVLGAIVTALLFVRIECFV